MATAVVPVLLAMVVLSIWVGAAGMLRMRSATESLHFLSVPGTLGMVSLLAAIFLQTGPHAAAWKAVVIAIVLLGINSVVAHATARAFRVRETGRWQHRRGDDMELGAK